MNFTINCDMGKVWFVPFGVDLDLMPFVTHVNCCGFHV